MPKWFLLVIYSLICLCRSSTLTVYYQRFVRRTAALITEVHDAYAYMDNSPGRRVLPCAVSSHGVIFQLQRGQKVNLVARQCSE